MQTKAVRKPARSQRPVAVGMGLVALDIVFTASSDAPPRSYAGGTCGNVLTILSYLGWRAYPVSRLRTDKAGNRLVQDLRRWDVSTDFITQSSDGSTPVIVQRIKHSTTGVPQHSFSWRCPSCGTYLPGYKPVLASSIETVALGIPRGSVFFFDRVSRGTLLMARIARKHGAIVVFEPASVGEPALFKEAWAVSHIVKYSHERLSEMSELGRSHAGNQGVLLEIETVGAEGLRYRSHLPRRTTSAWVSVAPYVTSKVKDTSGAGDWCTAGLLNAIGRKGAAGLEKTTPLQLRRALEYAQALAAWNCGFEGARGGMYQFNRARLDSEIRKIMRGAASPVDGSQEGLARSRENVAELCHSCNEQSSGGNLAARRK
jgi:sugar/nucleoside kinase (ribokinase family)